MIDRLWAETHAELRWIEQVGTVALAAFAAVAVHAATMAIVRRATRRTRGATDGVIVERFATVLLWTFVAIAVAVATRAVTPNGRLPRWWARAEDFVAPALVGWLALAGWRALLDTVAARADISVEDNLRARRRRTRAAILGRIGSVFIVFVTVCLMLVTIPGIRAIGVTLMASAGIAGLVVGAAAQPALKNLIAGVQMAFTEPIRLDDVVIVDAEWGRIEEIRLTFVVIRLWDDRRLVVPVAQFLEKSFQNWTRETSRLMGSVFWRLDPTVDVARLRERLATIVETNPRWDGRFFNLQVTDMTAEVVEIRALVTAKDAATAFDLRCDVRESMLAYIAAEMPAALPRRRVHLDQVTPAAPSPPDPPAPA